MFPRSRLTVAATILFVGSVGGVPALSAQAAQQAPSRTTRYYVQSIILKPDMVTEWMNLQKYEVIPAQKKAAVASRVTLATSVGDSFEYLILTPFPTWAAMDDDAPLVKALGADGAAQLNAKLRKCILVQRTYMTNRQDSLSIPPGDAKVWRYTIKQINPGKMGEYLAWYQAEIFPVMQKAKAAGMIAGSSISTRGAGAPNGEFVEVHYHNTFAELGGAGPMMAEQNAEARAKLNAKAATLATTKEVIVRRRVPELSF